jgi:hypothetical protein
MASLSVLNIAGQCGIQTPLSILTEVMAYGEYATASLRSVLTTMLAKSVANPDSAALLSLDATAKITQLTQSLSGYDYTIHLDLTLTNLKNDWVMIDSAPLFLTIRAGTC